MSDKMDDFQKVKKEAQTKSAPMGKTKVSKGSTFNKSEYGSDKPNPGSSYSRASDSSTTGSSTTGSSAGESNTSNEQSEQRGRSPDIPFRRYLFALSLLFFAMVQGLVWLSLLTPKANPFAENVIALSPSWWFSAVERLAPLRLAIIDTERPIKNIQPVLNNDDAILVSFEGEKDSGIEYFANIHLDGQVSFSEQSARAPLYEDKSYLRIDFGRDRLQIPHDKKESMDELVALMFARQEGTWQWKIRLESHTGPIGTAEYNQALSERRANVVSDYLKSIGVPSSAVESRSYGEAMSASQTKAASSRDPQELNKPAYSKDAMQVQQKGGIKRFSQQREEPTLQYEEQASAAGYVELRIEPPLQVKVEGERAKSAPDSIGWMHSRLSMDFYSLQNQNHRWRASEQGLIQWLDETGKWKSIAATTSLLQSYFKNKGYSRKELESKQWQSQSPSMYPPPISIAFGILLGGLAIALLLLPPKAEADYGSSIADFFVSDAPIEQAQHDRLNFASIANALSQFLRNERTSPPLTVAITGQWGSGKSSLMKLLRNDLQEHHIRPVWVNAWHHQNESQFLAELLESIRRDTLPPMFSAANLIFQTNILWLRVKDAPVKSTLALALLLVPLGYWMTTGNFVVPNFESFKDMGDSLPASSPLLSAMVSAFMFFQLIGSKISALTGNTWYTKLIGSRRQALDLRSMVGLREQFIEEFNYLCEALSPTTLTIFIDDLDRCHEKRILDILETVNFLVSNGNCVIVLGMEKEPVEKAIANYYSATHKDFSQDQLMSKASRYLEKLINIEVPVPQTSAAQAGDIASVSEKNTVSSKWAQYSSRVVCMLATAVLLLCVGIKLGDLYGYSTDTGASDGYVEQVANKGDQPADRPSLEEQVTLQSTERQALNASAAKSIRYHNAWVWWAMFGIVFVVLYMVFERIRQRQRVVVTDTEEFEDSIVVWGKLVGEMRPTPRRIKRFINRTRFLAMRRVNSETDLSEDALVTLAGIYEIKPSLFQNESVMNCEEIIKELRQSYSQENILILEPLINKNCANDKMGNIRLFKNWVGGVAVN